MTVLDRSPAVTDRAISVIVLAKQPVPGRVKTRLQTRFTAEQAADLAEAALQDTLHAVRRTAIEHRILAWEGDPADLTDDFAVIDQGAGDLGDRLARAFDVVLGERPGPTLLIAMDTPQITPDLLQIRWDGADAVIGFTDDGGYWGIGLRSGPAGPVFDRIPMSTDRTGAAQLARLLDLGLRVKILPPLRDVDTPVDADRVAEQSPHLGFSARLRELSAAQHDRRGPVGIQTVFDHAYVGRGLQATTTDGIDPLRIDGRLWDRPADAVDRLAIARCQPPVIDIGCGPGRMVAALIEQGQSALGVDVSGAAVDASVRNGGPALRRDLTGPLPGEGRWGTVLLMDSNIGIGGDVDALLRRGSRLVGPGGLIICETDPDPEIDEVHQVLLTAGGMSSPVRWARIGAGALARRAQALNLVITERWSAAGRDFLTLRTI